jgi:hypothetical protein
MRQPTSLFNYSGNMMRGSHKFGSEFSLRTLLEVSGTVVDVSYMTCLQIGEVQSESEAIKTWLNKSNGDFCLQKSFSSPHLRFNYTIQATKPRSLSTQMEFSLHSLSDGQGCRINL